MLAGEVGDDREGAIELAQSRVVQLQGVGVPAQPVPGLRHELVALREQPRRLVQRRIEARRLLQSAARRRHAAARSARLIVQRRLRLRHRLQQVACVGQAPVLVVQGAQAVRIQRLRLELRDLEAQVVEPRLAVPRAALDGLDLLLELAQPAMHPRDRVDAIAVPGVRVEQRALRRRLQQRLVRVLAVHVEEQLAQRLEPAHGHRTRVDEGPRAPVGGDHAAHDAVAAVVQRLLLQPAARRLARLEHGVHLRAAGVAAHQPGPRALADGELQRIDQQRFAGAGLAAQDRHPRREIQLQVVDDGEVAHAEVAEHRVTAPAPSAASRAAPRSGHGPWGARGAAVRGGGAPPPGRPPAG